MTESAADTTETKSYAAFARDKTGNIIFRNFGEKVPPDRIMLPFVLTHDPRLFVKDGEVTKPYQVITFAKAICEDGTPVTVDIPGLSLFFYSEAERTEFDPSDMTEVKPVDLEAQFAAMNAAEDTVAKR